MPDHFTTLFDFLPIGAYRSSPDGRQLRANPALVRLNGYASESEMLAAVNDIATEWYVDPDRRDQFAAALERDGSVVDFVSEIHRHKTRERIWIREAAHVVRDPRGEVIFFEGTVEDISAQRAVRVALEASERRFRALTERAQGLTLVCDAQSVVRYASPASQRLLDIAPEALVGHDILACVHPEDRAATQGEWRAVLEHRNSGSETIHRFAHAGGGWRYLACLANNCLADPAVHGVVLNFRDVTDRTLAEAALRRLVDRDELTGLANRRCLLEQVERALATSTTRTLRRHGLLFLDLDHFKPVNDRHGHRAGDLLLQAVAERLRRAVRLADVVARFGGDEFVVLLDDLGLQAEDAAGRLQSIGQEMLASLNEPYEVEGRRLEVGCSIGATCFGASSDAVERIVGRADEALYEAKQRGRRALRLCVATRQALRPADR